MYHIPTIDLIALIWFLLCWFGYSFYADLMMKSDSDNISKIMHNHRVDWMRNTMNRDDINVDISAIANFVRTGVFFASTSIFIVAFLLPLFSFAEKGVTYLNQIPLIMEQSQRMWEIKTLLLVVVFIYAFFKYTWSIRQYNYAITIILASNKNIDDLLINRNANVLSNAARHFSMGIRSYYFGLVMLSWFLHPVLFILLTFLVVIIIYRREFLSRLLKIINK